MPFTQSHLVVAFFRIELIVRTKMIHNSSVTQRFLGLPFPIHMSFPLVYCRTLPTTISYLWQLICSSFLFCLFKSIKWSQTVYKSIEIGFLTFRFFIITFIYYLFFVCTCMLWCVLRSEYRHSFLTANFKNSALLNSKD